MKRTARIERCTGETDIRLQLDLDGSGQTDIHSNIPFFDHMLTLWAVHGFFDLQLNACGDLAVDFHHTVEDIGLVLGEGLSQALGERKGIRRYGQARTPMDESLGTVDLDLSNRPFLVYQLPLITDVPGDFPPFLAKEFFRAFSNRGGLNLHIRVLYGENWHHMIESVFKSLGRALDQAVSFDPRIQAVRSSKGML